MRDTEVSVNQNKEIILKSLEDTKKLGIDIANNLSNNDIILLKGDLGVGKTQLSKIIINSLCDEDVNVTSPTFNIVQIYDTRIGQVWHFDLYRINHEDELFDIGFEDAVNEHTCIIEWPEIAKNFIGNKYLQIDMSFDGDDRVVKVVSS